VRAPALHNRLAGVYIEMGSLDDAKRVLGDIVTVFPDDPQTHVLLGRVAFRASDWATARKHYERATWEAPFNPEIHVGLLKIAEATKDDALLKKQKRAVELLAGAAKTSNDVPARAAEGEPYGILEVRSTPWGRVLIDGVDVGTTTPLIDYRVKPGAHRVRVIDPVTGMEQGDAVTITEGQVSRVELTLEDLSPERRKSLIDAEEALKPKPAAPTPKKTTAHEGAEPPVVPSKPMAPWETDDDDDDDEPMSLPIER
jgi:tetratricopeptide (TPR) repeat protein